MRRGSGNDAATQRQIPVHQSRAPSCARPVTVPDLPTNGSQNRYALSPTDGMAEASSASSNTSVGPSGTSRVSTWDETRCPARAVDWRQLASGRGNGRARGFIQRNGMNVEADERLPPQNPIWALSTDSFPRIDVGSLACALSQFNDVWVSPESGKISERLPAIGHWPIGSDQSAASLLSWFGDMRRPRAISSNRRWLSYSPPAKAGRSRVLRTTALLPRKWPLESSERL